MYIFPGYKTKSILEDSEKCPERKTGDQIQQFLHVGRTARMFAQSLLVFPSSYSVALGKEFSFKCPHS